MCNECALYLVRDITGRMWKSLCYAFRNSVRHRGPTSEPVTPSRWIDDDLPYSAARHWPAPRGRVSAISGLRCIEEAVIHRDCARQAVDSLSRPLTHAKAKKGVEEPFLLSTDDKVSLRFPTISFTHHNKYSASVG